MVSNVDLWMELDGLAELHRTSWTSTKGQHARGQQSLRLACPECRPHTNEFLARQPPARPATALDLARGYLPPKPQAGLFDDFDEGDEEEEVLKLGPLLCAVQDAAYFDGVATDSIDDHERNRRDHQFTGVWFAAWSAAALSVMRESAAS